MDENTQAKFEARLKDLIAVAKKKKNVLEYQEINEFFSLIRFWRHWNRIMSMS